ncbi:ABC transporter [Alteribacter lacisalsi]|uniref:ABC transporter n=1 Tax=Alteribacter lacisalsi TaxID=2045244 RepID=A0A2W0HA60_9BACI|nr:ABC transporter ATP-binding protein [Alteribacter lacisalsi]PYZ98743.1 ABC transporter [Alteribacter lacisalsi]
MILIKDLTKMYGRKFCAVKNVSLHIKEGSLTGLVGPNGSGKTTIINSILGVVNASEGTVRLKNHLNTSRTFKRHVAYVPDDLLLPEVLTGHEYLKFKASMYELDVSTKEDRCQSLSRLYSMEQALHEPIETYSHGMKKKTQLMAAFMLSSRFLILDEPFRGLDVEAAMITKKMLHSYKSKGNAILLSTHDLLAAETFCDQVAILVKGTKVADDSVLKLKMLYGARTLEEVFLKASNLQERSREYDQIISNL